MSLPMHNNYGGILQNYALCKYITSLGHEVLSCRWASSSKSCPLATWRKPFVYLKRLLTRQEIYREKRNAREYDFVNRHFIRFINDNIPLTERAFYKKTELYDFVKKEKIDAVIVGSDQVWRKTYPNSSFFNKIIKPKAFPNLNTFFLDFLQPELNVKILSYAASFGVDYAELNEKEQKTIFSLLSKFAKVGVREKSAINLIQNIYHWNVYVEQVIDPTMLLKCLDYKVFFENINNPSKANCVFIYALDNSSELKEIASFVQERIGAECMKSIFMNNDDSKSPLQERVFPSIENWLYNISESNFIVTDSFHGTVFSILFEKPFIVLKNTGRGNTRFDSLLSMFGLENRILSEKNSLEDIVSTPIDWAYVKEVLKREREKARMFFKEAHFT